MGNHIADLIYHAETEKNESKKAEFKKECFDTILKLWSQREELSSRLQPLGNYKKVISVLNSLKQEEPSFDWNHYEGLNDPGAWGKFVKELKNNYRDAIEIAICVSAGPKYLAEGREWLNYEKMLSNDERLIIENLNHLLTKSDSPFSVRLFDEGEEKKGFTSVSKKERVLNKLTEMIEKQNRALSQLKHVIEKENS